MTTMRTPDPDLPPVDRANTRSPAEPGDLATDRLTERLNAHPVGQILVEAADVRLLLGQLRTVRHVAQSNSGYVAYLYTDLTAAQDERDAATAVVARVEALQQEWRSAGVPGDLLPLLGVRVGHLLDSTAADTDPVPPAVAGGARACHACGHSRAAHSDDAGDQCLLCPVTAKGWRHAFTEWPA